MTGMVLPFEPNWSTSYKIVREFKTTVQTSRSGKEQRRALRMQPRKTVSFTATVFADDMRKINRLLAKNLGYELYLADETRWATLTADMPIGGVTATLDSAPPWLDRALVLRNNDTWGVLTVQGVAGDVVTFTGPSVNDWPAGTQIYPAMEGRLAQSIKMNLRSDAAQDVQIEFDVTPLGEPAYTPPAAPVTFNLREVFLTPPNWQTDPSVTVARPLETNDYGYGIIAYFNPVAFLSRTQQATWLAMSSQQVMDLEATFLRALGQRGEFYMPTWQNDLPLAVVARAGLDILTVVGTDVFNNYAGDTVFMDFCVVYADGTYQFAQVQQITSDGTNTLIQTTQGFGKDIDPATVQMICWMPVCRFASDGMTTEWLTNTVAQMQLAIVTLEDLAPEMAS